MAFVGKARGHLPTLLLNLKELAIDKGLHPNSSFNLYLPD